MEQQGHQSRRVMQRSSAPQEALQRYQERYQDSECISLHGSYIPLEWLTKRDTYPESAVVSPATQRQNFIESRWAASREQLLAAGAAGIHLAMFAHGLMFWGFEGMPQDRYWPANPRIKLQIRPGRYGNLEGSKRFYYDNLARLEGAN